jgi:hypothetical protein
VAEAREAFWSAGLGNIPAEALRLPVLLVARSMPVDSLRRIIIDRRRVVGSFCVRREVMMV